MELSLGTATAFAKVDPYRAEQSLGAGVRLPAMGGGCFVVGRVQHDDIGRAPLPAAAFLGESIPEQSDERLQLAAVTWAARARTEWASVPAFHDLAWQLAWTARPRR